MGVSASGGFRPGIHAELEWPRNTFFFFGYQFHARSRVFPQQVVIDSVFIPDL
jgi:hypothetical protein